MKRLVEIQQKLKAPKNQYNNFGEYHYRSCEDILEAVKPLLGESGLALTLKDDVIFLGERYYIKATATIYDETGKEIASTSALARETFEKKKSDDSQLTGAASSYARKYALNGLLCIDDTKDADTPPNQKDKPKNTTKKEETESPIDEYAEIDIYEGLKETTDTKRAFAYFQEQLKNVSDKTKFRQEYQKHYNKLKKAGQ